MPTIVKQDDTGEKPTPEKRKPVPAGFRKFTKEMADHLASETYKAACVGGYANQMRVFFKKIVDIGNRYLKVDAHILIPFFFHFLRRIRMAVPSAAELSVSGTVSNPAVKDVLPMHLHMLMLRDFMGPEAVKCTQAITTKGHGPFIGPGHAICFGTPFTRKLRVLFPATRDGDKQWRLDDDLPVLDANTFWTAIHFNAGVADTVMRGFLADESNKQSDAADAQLRFDVWIKAFNLGLKQSNFSVPDENADAGTLWAFYGSVVRNCLADLAIHVEDLEAVTNLKPPNKVRHVRIAYPPDDPQALLSPAKIIKLLEMMDAETKSMFAYQPDDPLDLTTDFMWDAQVFSMDLDLTDPALHTIHSNSFHCFDDAHARPEADEHNSGLHVMSAFYLAAHDLVQEHWAFSRKMVQQHKAAEFTH